MADLADTGNEVATAAKRIPPAGWALLIAGGVVLGLYLRNRNRSSAPAAPAEPEPLPTLGGTVTTPTLPGAAIQGPRRADTNLEWLREGLQLLIARGVDAGVADTALHAYLDGDPLDLAGSNAVKIVLAEMGPPPEGIPAPHYTPNPPNPVPASPPPVAKPPPAPRVPLYPGTSRTYEQQERWMAAKHARAAINKQISHLPRGSTLRAGLEAQAAEYEEVMRGINREVAARLAG